MDKVSVEGAIRIDRIDTPLGSMLAGATEGAICFLGFAEASNTRKDIDRLKGLLDCDLVEGHDPALQKLKLQLGQYFEGKRTKFDLLLRIVGTPFQKAAWEALQEIPYAETISYEEQAHRIGRPKAVRAVARANGANRIAIVVPCHRVIGKTGKLVGYGAGLWRKQKLLDIEEKYLSERKR